MLLPQLERISLYPLVSGAPRALVSTNSVQTLLSISHGLEDLVIRERWRTTFFAGFQRLAAFLPQLNRFARLAAYCGHVLIFAELDAPAPEIPNLEFVPLAADAPLAREWFIVVDTPLFSGALLTRQLDETRRVSDAPQHFGRGRSYEGILSFDPGLVSAARHLLDSALERPHAPVAHAQGNAFDAQSPHYVFSRALLADLEQRNRQLSGLYETLNARHVELEQLHQLMRTMVSTMAWEKAVASFQAAETGAPAAQETFSILFTDIQEFTRLSETVPSQFLLVELNRYFDVLATSVYQMGGDIDKFMGDGMLAFFRHPADALRAAVLMQRRVNAFNTQQLAARKPVFATRAAIATGPAVVGRVGSRDRQEVTILGDTVNTASRLQSMAPVGGLVMDASTYFASGAPRAAIRRSAQIRGKADLQILYELAPDAIAEFAM